MEINHYNGDSVREQWPIGMKIKFKPKGWCGGEELEGEIIGHIYTSVLIVKTGHTELFVSTVRATHPNF